jgi:hypothetical protein
MNIRRRKEWDQRVEEKRVRGEEAKKKNQWEINMKRRSKRVGCEKEELKKNSVVGRRRKETIEWEVMNIRSSKSVGSDDNKKKRAGGKEEEKNSPSALAFKGSKSFG